MDPADFSSQQHELWQHVESLWRLLGSDEAVLRAALHPRYWGWVIGDDEPHDREAGVRAAATSPPVIDLRLDPKRVEVYAGSAGVAHEGSAGGGTLLLTNVRCSSFLAATAHCAGWVASSSRPPSSAYSLGS